MTESSPVLSDALNAEGSPSLELVQAIDALRAQLTAAVERSRGQRVQFELGEVEIEFTVSLSRDAKAEGGVKIWVLSLGASGARSSAAVQRLKVTLKPTDTHTGQSPQIADRSENSLPD
jgi:NTP-dependent ternary system trypsin peptidase co-occuring protein